MDRVPVRGKQAAAPSDTKNAALVIDRVTKRFTVGRKRKPVTAISKMSKDAIIGPARMANLPAAMPGQLCMP